MFGRLLVQLIVSILCLTQASSAAPSLAKPGCNDTCGSVSIPYPFGVGKDCYLNEWFSVYCDRSTPFLGHPNLNGTQVSSILLADQTVFLQIPAVDFCKLPKLEGTQVLGSSDLGGSPFLFSADGNDIRFMGCGNATLLSRLDKVLAGCSTICDNTSTVDGLGVTCSGINCCRATPPFAFDFYRLIATSTQNFRRSGWPHCTLSVLGSNLISSKDNSTSWTHLQLIWKIEESAGGYNCTNNTSGEWSKNNISNYKCSCGPYEEGNPYLPHPHGCQVVEACANCKGSCLTRIDGRFFCNERSLASKFWILGISLGGGLLFLLLGGFWLYKVLRRRQKVKLREQFFQQLLLQHQMSSNEVGIENTKIFTFKELKKASDNFSEDRILGRGGQGTVYKGMLTDGRIIAIKRSKVAYESQYEQFINEIVILSQINHRNIVKLLGCCLEKEVPLLVYEFIPNGTLFQLIHDKNNELPFSWERRLEIATEVAGALAYLHSASSTPIFHRDIKSKNVLLDEKYRAKVADFGLSRSVSIDQTHLTTPVQGTFGYFDPEYFRTGQFTEKSDVYSFGVVLAELLTGQEPISSIGTEEEKSLANYFIFSIKETCLFDILDAQVVKEGREEEIMAVVNLATQSLNLNGKKRPTMKEVALELERIKSHAPLHVPGHFELAEYVRTEIIGPSDGASSSAGSCLIYGNTSSFNENSLLSNTL